MVSLWTARESYEESADLCQRKHGPIERVNPGITLHDMCRASSYIMYFSISKDPLQVGPTFPNPHPVCGHYFYPHPLLRACFSNVDLSEVIFLNFQNNILMLGRCVGGGGERGGSEKREVPMPGANTCSQFRS
jgi:hypothetical protein